MTTLVDCDKLCTYNAMSIAVTKELIQRDLLKTLQINQNGIIKMFK